VRVSGAPIDPTRMTQIMRGLAPLILELEAAIAEIPAEMEPEIRIVSLPWQVPEREDEIAAQRAALDRAGELGIEEIWFLQTGTHLPFVTPDADEDADDEDADEDEADEDEANEADDEDEGGWSQGPPPQTNQVRFPVDNYPEILESYDWEDFGITCKLGGAWVPGEATVLYGLHALWLGPYGGRHRNTAVTIDQRHHAVHFWVDRFTAPCDSRELAHHLLWIVAQLDEIFPVLHARFEGATMAQKYGGLVGDTSEPFVLGGNPLRALHTIGGTAAVDAWIASQTSWSHEELAVMLRELAMDVMSAPTEGEAAEDADEAEDDADAGKVQSDVEIDVDAMFDVAFEGDEDEEDEQDDGDAGDEDDGADDADADDADDAGDDDDDDDDDDDGDDDDASGATAGAPAADENHVSRPARHASLPMIASELLAARAKAGLLDPRVAEALAAIPTRDAADSRLAAAQRVLTAVRERATPDDHDVN